MPHFFDRKFIMFTGLIEKTGKLVSLTRRNGGGVLRVEHTRWKDEALSPGDSVAVQGACLTVSTCKPDEFTADILDETLARTSLGSKTPGNLLNLERALKAGARLGGHIVAGHIDGTGQIVARKKETRDWILTVNCVPEILKGIVIKGSITIDGISLTVSDLSATSFSVNVIPFTLENTSLRNVKIGDTVNLETDIIGKYVLKYSTESASSQISLEKLHQAGFI